MNFWTKKEWCWFRGTGFGEEGEGYIRFTYAADEESLKRGLERIQRFVRGNRVRRED